MKLRFKRQGVTATNAFFERKKRRSPTEKEAAAIAFCLEQCDTAKHAECNGNCEELIKFKREYKKTK